MSAEEKPVEINQEMFFDVMKKTYEKGKNSNEMTIQKLLEDLILDLKTITE